VTEAKKYSFPTKIGETTGGSRGAGGALPLKKMYNVRKRGGIHLTCYELLEVNGVSGERGGTGEGTRRGGEGGGEVIYWENIVCDGLVKNSALE